MNAKNTLTTKLSVHADHKEWLGQLDFYQDQISFFQKELIKVNEKHNDSFSTIEYVNEYRNIFIKKLSHIDDLRHAIEAHEEQLAHSPTVNTEQSSKHSYVRERFQKFVSDFEKMKDNFKRFAAYND